MDEKTESLREVFLEVSDTETVTEAQSDARGTLTDDTSTDERLEAMLAEMRERYTFRSDLTDDQLLTVIRRFYDGDSDAAIADAVECSEQTVFEARLDLHCFREEDFEAPFAFDAFRRAVAQGASVEDLVDRFEASTATIRRYRQLLEARDQARRANDRYRDEFAELLADADLTGGLTQRAREDGLDEATEDMEIDVSF